MAKKQTPDSVIQDQEVINDVNTKVTYVEPKVAKTKNVEDGWVIKDRSYVLTGNKLPITFTLASKHHSRNPLMWFDEELGYARELRYASNQRSPFRDEQDGFATLKHIVFRDGALFVPRSDQALQKLLSIYHPQKNKTYRELDAVAEAKDDLFDIELEIQALVLARDLDIDHAEAVLRVEQGSSVSKMTTSEIRRDLLLFAKSQPDTFISLVEDENVQLRNIAIKAVEANIIQLADDNKTFKWALNQKKIMTVPFDENPYSAIASYFKTDEGAEVFNSIQKKLK